MTTNRTSPFAGFEEVALPEGAAELVFGVNVLQIQASVRTTEDGTVAELIAKYRDQLNLPADVVVFVDGAKMSPEDRLPEGYQRVELVKPAGSKGRQLLSDTPQIPLNDEDAAIIVIAAEDTINYLFRQPVEEGKISVSLEFRLSGTGLVVLSRGKSYLTVGHFDEKILATRKVLRPLAEMRRRVSGGVADSDPVTVNDIKAGQHASRVELNSQPFSGCVDLKAGDHLTVVVEGVASTQDYTKVFARAGELAGMGSLKLRPLALSKKVKAAGKGRTLTVIAADILRAEFPDLPEDPDFVVGLIKKNEE